MNMKKVIALSVAALTALSATTVAFADEKIWPDGTPTVYVGYGAGGGTDTAVRPVVAAMAEYLGENINVANMEGANSSVACDYVLDAEEKDGYRAYNMFATGTGGFSSFSVYGYSDSSWQDWVSFHPYSGPAVVFANPDAGIETADDLFAYLGEGNNFGVGAMGNGPHTQFEAICAAAGVDAPEYSLFGSCADTGVACIAGDVMVGAGSLSSVIEYLNSGMLNPIFVTCADPITFDTGVEAPSVTTCVEGTDAVPNLNETWPIMVARDTDPAIIEKLTEAFNYAIETDEVKEFAASKGFNIIGLTGEEADQFLSYSISGYAWTIYNAGLADGNPADAGIPTLEDYDWETLKATIE